MIATLITTDKTYSPLANSDTATLHEYLGATFDMITLTNTTTMWVSDDPHHAHTLNPCATEIAKTAGVEETAVFTYEIEAETSEQAEKIAEEKAITNDTRGYIEGSFERAMHAY